MCGLYPDLQISLKNQAWQPQISKIPHLSQNVPLAEIESGGKNSGIILKDTIIRDDRAKAIPMRVLKWHQTEEYFIKQPIVRFALGSERNTQIINIGHAHFYDQVDY